MILHQVWQYTDNGPMSDELHCIVNINLGYLPGSQVKNVLKKTGFQVRETKHRSSRLNEGGHQAVGAL